MAGSATVLSDDTVLSRLDRGLERLELSLAFVSGLFAFVLMFLAVFSVSGREFFKSPLPGYVDWIEFLMPVIAILGVSYVQRSGGHIRMDIVVGQLGGRALWLVEFITTALVLILMILLVWGTWAHFDRSFDLSRPNWSRDSTIDIGLPLWPAKLVVPVAFAVISLRLALQMWGFGRAFLRNEDRPVAVPLIQSAAEQAAAEAEHLMKREN